MLAFAITFVTLERSAGRPARGSGIPLVGQSSPAASVTISPSRSNRDCDCGSRDQFQSGTLAPMEQRDSARKSRVRTQYGEKALIIGSSALLVRVLHWRLASSALENGTAARAPLLAQRTA